MSDNTPNQNTDQPGFRRSTRRTRGVRTGIFLRENFSIAGTTSNLPLVQDPAAIGDCIHVVSPWPANNDAGNAAPDVPVPAVPSQAPQVIDPQVNDPLNHYELSIRELAENIRNWPYCPMAEDLDMHEEHDQQLLRPSDQNGLNEDGDIDEWLNLELQGDGQEHGGTLDR
ncbi:hypothetical protein FZEAL_1766 [Fusarium zealandicum]|uniref:Uncharacterized protein n=1 Tax=Fusarium zealandicum TaxID=1053134 RepID=A0A8H4XPK9_9HYPO|nr:hypothetical protein FZEAL_1766 [Fusarium zealandicum]